MIRIIDGELGVADDTRSSCRKRDQLSFRHSWFLYTVWAPSGLVALTRATPASSRDLHNFEDLAELRSMCRSIGSSGYV